MYIKTPSGYSFKKDIANKYNYYYHYHSFTLYKKELKIGSIHLQDEGYTYSTHSWLDEQYHGKGLGTFMYAKVIQFCHKKKYKIGSSTYFSEKAGNVWKGKGLKKYFLIKKVNAAANTYRAYPKKIK